MKKKDIPLGIVLYRGESQIDNKLIVVIATGFKHTNNAKTGDMIQTWIIRGDRHPQDALRQGADYSVCGDCKHRDFRSCYVNIGRAVSMVWGAYCRGRYESFSYDKHLALFRDRDIRLGSYGDPAAVPFEVWAEILPLCKKHTAYTHQWKKCDPVYADICMASCDTPEEAKRAKALGWRTFRVRLDENDVLLEGEYICPASAEGGKKTDCEHCNSCCGVNNMPCPAIIVHGKPHKIRYFKDGIKKIKNHRKWRTAKRSY